MALFSQRKGLTPLKPPLQLEEMSEELRNGLWTAVDVVYLESYKNGSYEHLQQTNRFVRNEVTVLFANFWVHFFKLPSDTMPTVDDGYALEMKRQLRNKFFSATWNYIYDFLEFTIKHGGDFQQEGFRNLCNVFLQRENSGYRFVGLEIMPITSPTEIESIEKAMNTNLISVNTHLATAVSLLADRKTPDYRNSIKESISAVESTCRAIANDDNATLGSALKIIREKGSLHPALEKSFSSLYGYTSDQGGIRHSLTEESTPITFTDAKFMLVTCSAFITYLLGKAADLNIKIKNR